MTPRRCRACDHHQALPGQALCQFCFAVELKVELQEPTPTQAAPGSVEKLEILRLRFQRGEKLFHEDDKYDYSGVNGADIHPAMKLPLAERLAGVEARVVSTNGGHVVRKDVNQ